MKKHLPLLVLAAFTVFSLECAIEAGIEGFGVFFRAPWALQFAVDLYLSIFFVGAWMHRDARARGISATPFIVLLPFVGTVGALLYLVRRNYAATASLAPREGSSVAA